MSAFVVCLQRDSALVSKELIEAMSDVQRHRGSDQTGIHMEANAGFAYRALWTTPEETGARQPLMLPELPFILVWTGRIDNRGELLTYIRNTALEAWNWSDAELFLRLYAERQAKILPHIVGSFALAMFDRRRQNVLLARDPIGNRDLNFFLTRDVLVAATEEAAVLAHPHLSPELNRTRLAGHFACAGTHHGETFFRDVCKLLPGHYMVVDADTSSLERYRTLDVDTRLYYRDNREYAEHYRALLESAVACRTRSAHPIGVMTSGGLDSGPIAALAASRAGAGTRVSSLSWVFDRYAECDERQYLRPLWRRFDLVPLEVNCDDAQPFSDLDHWPVHPATPDQDPYRRFLDRTYEAARDNGIRVVLNGGAGDNLYLAGDHWFWELLSCGDLPRALSGAGWYIREAGLHRFVRRIVIRSLLSYRLIKTLRPDKLPDWITDTTATLLQDRYRWPPEYRHARRPAQCLLLTSLRASDFISAESYWCDRHNVEVRYPLRDLRVIEFMLQVPDHQLEFMGLRRAVLRQAVADLLPEAQLHRQDKTVFTSVFKDGADRNAAGIERLLRDPSNIWPEFVRRNWVLGDGAPTQSTSDTLKWMVVSFELWRVSQGLSL